MDQIDQCTRDNWRTSPDEIACEMSKLSLKEVLHKWLKAQQKAIYPYGIRKIVDPFTNLAAVELLGQKWQ
jgi:hypothetical protein